MELKKSVNDLKNIKSLINQASQKETEIIKINKFHI